MRRLTSRQDAYGHGIYDSFRGKEGYEVAERDDGYLGVALGPSLYLARYEDWPAHQRKAMHLARGHVLDIGCGGGRVGLYLQEKGLDVLGIDTSPLAIKTCRLRGLRHARVLSVTQLSRRLGTFDTIIMYGNNFGLFGSVKRARWLLKRFHGMTSDRGRILAESNDPYRTRQRCHLDYHKRNKARGRMPGQVRIRIRYRTYCTPWFDYLLASKDEMRAILDDTGWVVSRFYDSGGSTYVAVIEKGR